jgi:2-C-methyl-D-erythritol 4-phosphate cytidylyltransferase/2-C-methyl-D-erythritol 2,4-cyclodiphosphate synthase
MVHFLILAGGTGERAKKSNKSPPKQYMEFNNISPLRYLLKNITKINEISSITVVISKENIKEYKRDTKGINNLRKYVIGGKTRRESSLKGIKNLKNEFGNKKNQKVLIHDAARPFISKKIILQSIKNLKKYSATCPYVNIEDTIKSIDYKNKLNNIDRNKLISLQTPQGFGLNEIFELHKKNKKELSDDFSLIINKEISFKLIKGSKENFKITTNEDLLIFNNIILSKKKNLVGIGFDIHAFTDGNEITLGGLKLKSKYKLLAHSDGDVLLHSITDAILGATNKNDIGVHFPPSKSKYKNSDSVLFLNKAMDFVKKLDGRIINLDINLICDYPKINPIKLKLKKNLSKLLDLEIDKINIKATTTEDQGFINFKKGIASQAIVSIEAFNEE